MENSTGSSSTGRGLSQHSVSGPSSAFWSSPWTVTAVIACAILCCCLIALLVVCISKRWRRCSRNCSYKAGTCWGSCCHSAPDRSPGGSDQRGSSNPAVGVMSLASIRQQLSVRRMSGGHSGYGCLKEEVAADDDGCLPTSNSDRAASPAARVAAGAEPVTPAKVWQQNEEQHNFAWPAGSIGSYKSLPSELPKIAPPAVAVQPSHIKPTVVAAIAAHRHRESSLFGGGGASGDGSSPGGDVAGARQQPYTRRFEEASPAAGNRPPECNDGGSSEQPEVVYSRRTAL